MHDFIYWLSSLTKSLLAILSLSLLWAGSCNSEEKASEVPHPLWYLLDEPEDRCPKDQCLITKFGLGVLRFHVADHQQPFHSKDAVSKTKKNIVQTGPEAVNVVLTPNFYGFVTNEKFPNTVKDGMKYRSYDHKKEKGGIPLSFLAEWLAIDLVDYKEVVLIVSTGIEGKLGISESLKKALNDKKEKGEIQDYHILKSREAIVVHNRYVKEGKKVFTFIHTAG